MVCRCNSVRTGSHKQLKERIRMHCPRRETTVPRMQVLISVYLAILLSVAWYGMSLATQTPFANINRLNLTDICSHHSVIAQLIPGSSTWHVAPTLFLHYSLVEVQGEKPQFFGFISCIFTKFSLDVLLPAMWY